MRRIAPPDLKDREAELGELAAFCTGDADDRYAWWRAPAWAGKSALMSWFVLHPPPGVRIVSFFVTARHHRQNDRRAYLDNVVEQLADLLDQRGLPAGLTESTQETHLLSMLASAADACRRSGTRLVLLVDGLDEDRGVTVGPDSYSIAATLPRNPPDGLRVVVTSRPDPPLPPDVPSDHPLRGRCRVRELGPSGYAAAVRADAERELKGLLLAGGTGRTVLGLVTAADDGLTVADLAELSGEDEWLVGDHLSSFTGRAFARAGDAYVLAHEELQALARTLLGPARLHDHREQLHRWADRYRELGWPAGTPEYLLLGYFRLLTGQGDHSRMVRNATDAGRHDRLLDHTGGDAVALEEVALTQTALMENDPVDLVAMCRLALHQADLERRNTHIPLALPRLWASVGNVTRAEALVRSISEESGKRGAALAVLAPEVARAGHHAHAERLVGLIPERVFLDENQPGMAVSDVAYRVAVGGEHERALRIARNAPPSYWRSRATGHVAVGIARGGGSLTEAETIVSQVPMGYWRAQAFSALAEEAHRRSVPGLARRLADSAAAEALDVEDSADRAMVYSSLALDSSHRDDPGQARHLADRAVRAATEVPEPHRRVEALTKIVPRLATVVGRADLVDLARLAESALSDTRNKDSFTTDRLAGAVGSAWYAAGNPEHAETIAASVPARLAVIESAAAADDLPYARRLADSLPGAGDRDRAYARILSAAEGIDDDSRTEMVDAIRDLCWQANALTYWGHHAARRGDRDTATSLAERAETISRSIDDRKAEIALLAPLVSALVTMEDLGRARAAGRRAISLYRSARASTPAPDSALELLARGTAAAGDDDAAVEAAGLINDVRHRAAMVIELAPIITGPDRSRSAAESLADAEEAAKSRERAGRRYALQEIMTAWWVLGECTRAESLATWIDEDEAARKPSAPAGWPAFGGSARAETSPAARERDPALVKAVEAIAGAGEFARAEALVGLVADPRRRAEARTRLVVSLARAGHDDRALAHAYEPSPQQGKCLQELAEVFAERGAVDLAARVVADIGHGYDRARASIAVARTVEPAQAGRFLAMPIRHGRLSEIVDLLAVVCPEAVVAVADHLLD